MQEWNKNENSEQKIPPFEVRLVLRKWGQIQTEVLSIECAKIHAQYMKYLISTAVEKKLLQGCLFVPIGIHLMKSLEVLANLLRQHNHIIVNLRTFEVYGIHPQHDTTHTEDNKNQKLIDKIKSSNLIHKMERTSSTEDRGIWTIIVQKSNEERARKFLETLMTDCTKKPRFMPRQNYDKQQKGSNDHIVGSYANYLEEIAQVKEDTPAASTTTDFDICETLKMRKSYKAILLNTEPGSELNDPGVF